MKLKIFPLNFFVLQMMGFWRPPHWSSLVKIVIYHFYSCFMCFTLHSVTIYQLIEIIKSPGSVDNFIKNSRVLLTMMNACAKSINFFKRRGDILKAIDLIASSPCCPRDAAEDLIQGRYDRCIRRNSIIYGGIIHTAVCSRVLEAARECAPNRMLPFKSWIPYGIDSDLSFWLTYIQQNLAAFISGYVSICYDTIVPGCMVLTCAQLQIFKSRLQQFCPIDNKIAGENPSNGDADPKLISDCVQHHLKILQFVEATNNIFTATLFTQFSISSLVICVSVYDLSKTTPFTGDFVEVVLYLMSMLLELYIFCLYGNDVTVESGRIANYIYDLDWPSLDTSVQKDLLIVMMRTMKPLRFTSGHIYVLSLATFSGLLKTSYTTYSVLQQMSDSTQHSEYINTEGMHLSPVAFSPQIQQHLVTSGVMKVSILSLNFFVLQIMGFWKPPHWSSSWKIIIYNFYSCLMCFTLYSVTVSQLIEMIRSPGTIEDVINNSRVLLTMMNACAKSLSFITRRDDILKAIGIIASPPCNPRDPGEIIIQEKYDRSIRMNSIIYGVFIQTSVNTVILQTAMECIPNRILPFKSWIPYDITSDLIFWLTYIQQTVATYVTSYVNICYDTIVPGCMVQTCAQLQIFKSRLKDLCDRDCENIKHCDDSEDKKLVSDIVEHHLKILKFAELTNSIFTSTIFTQFGISSLVICVSVYDLSRAAPLSPYFVEVTLYLMSMMLEIYLFCFYGHNVTVEPNWERHLRLELGFAENSSAEESPNYHDQVHEATHIHQWTRGRAVACVIYQFTKNVVFCLQRSSTSVVET
ncbi:uncharacterized protein LOC135167118 [Diachasmimorpha longicaudata]|uniref:uncharacterized protein LOC135167118 n=1 Tax=Diachasmimorpha longicaudata TaxID=58733 RepID=UPI0030B86967